MRHDLNMPKRSSTSDINQIAAAIVEHSTNGSCKNPAAVALGRLGGLKGGKARAESLSKERRAQIAKNAAAKRWRKPKT